RQPVAALGGGLAFGLGGCCWVRSSWVATVCSRVRAGGGSRLAPRYGSLDIEGPPLPQLSVTLLSLTGWGPRGCRLRVIVLVSGRHQSARRRYQSSHPGGTPGR